MELGAPVLPPQAAHPDEELMSLVFFYELDHDAVVTPLAPPVGRRAGLDAGGERAVHPGAPGRDLGGLTPHPANGPLVGCRGRIPESASGTRAPG